MADTLKLKSPMMHGPAVKRAQEILDMLGYPIDPIDGIYGPDTEARVREFQKDRSLKADGILGPATRAALLLETESFNVESKSDPIYDIRGDHPRPKLYHKRRSWASIEGVTLHQTGCEMPVDPLGWSRLNAHIGITQEGRIVIVNDPCDWIWHAQGLSKRTIGIEIEGNFEGIKGNPNTLWKGGGGPHYLNPLMLYAADRLFTWLLVQFMSNKQIWKKVYAHRQSAKSRTADPGSAIWQAIGMPWIEQLGASDGGPAFTRGEGKPIPRKWNPSYLASYW